MITPSLPIKHDPIVIVGWGVEVKRGASPSTGRHRAQGGECSQRDKSSSWLMSFSVEVEKAGRFREVAGVSIVDAGGPCLR